MASDRKTKVALVVGAGGSKDFLLPLGSELKSNIGRLLDIGYKDGYRLSSGDYAVAEALGWKEQELGGPKSPNAFLPAARHIRDAMPLALSIDNFIDCVRGDPRIETCGKIAICKSILDAERSSNIYVGNERDSIRFRTIQSSWLGSFLQLLTENCTATELRDRLSSLTIITFNYDRCIEHFLHYWFRTYYQASTDQASELVALIDFYHPYGKVGSLPFQKSALPTPFGEDPEPRHLLALSSQIKTFTEQSESLASELSEARSALGQAKHVLFIGFAFHEQNMRLICPYPRTLRTTDKAFATAVGFSESDSFLIRQDIAIGLGLNPDNVVVRNNLNGPGLFSEYSRSVRWPKT